MTRSKLTVRTDVPWDPASILCSPERAFQEPEIIIDRRMLSGWSFIPWRTGKQWDFPLPSGSEAPSSWDRCRSLLEEMVFPDCYTSLREPPFQSGYLLLLPYEAGEIFEPAGTFLPEPRFPVTIIECLEVVAYHHETRTLFLPASCPYIPNSRPENDRRLSSFPTLPAALLPSMSLAEYREKIACIQDAIGRGKYFQLNFAMRFEAAPENLPDLLGLYLNLSRANPSPGMGFFSRKGTTIVSNSPERLLTIEGNRLTTTPIAGTLPLLSNRDLSEKDFGSDPKERAEHIMTVDLLRNDVGRISRSGSIDVPRLLAVERYAHLLHLVSDIRGTLKIGTSMWDILCAMFPGGSVTGAPKIAVRKDIARLEKLPRGYYCGAIGIWDPAGFADFNILIRTVIRQGTSLSLPVGSGIVSDSIADKEYREIRAKAMTIMERMGARI